MTPARSNHPKTDRGALTKDIEAPPDHKSTSALSREENAACPSEFCAPSLPTRVGPWSVGERMVSSEAQLRACMGTGHMT
jgi:hypothetical protein